MHLAELLNKIDLPREQYFVVQSIYAGWALFGFPVFAALFSLLVLVISLRRERRPMIWALVAFLCIVATQVVFWTWTYPMNVATNKWTTIPENWEALRRQWEYAHAVNAVLTFIAIALSRPLGARAGRPCTGTPSHEQARAQSAGAQMRQPQWIAAMPPVRLR